MILARKPRRRTAGTIDSPRYKGTNPRSKATNPRATSTNPRAVRLQAFATALMNGAPAPYHRGPVADTIDGWERPGNRATMAAAAGQLEHAAAGGRLDVEPATRTANLEWMDWAEELAEAESEEPP